MQTQINNDQGPDQFESAQEQVLTYVLSQQIPHSPTSKKSRRTVPKINERPRLQLVAHSKELVKQFNFRDVNKNIRKSQESHGKVIRIGSVTFRSNFECGNVNNVQLAAFNTYHIELQKETNSNRVSSWFYFSVEGVKGEAHFVIRGFTKSSSLYNEGMKVCFRDLKEMGKWRRGGTRITYTNTEDDEDQDRKGYELRFSHFFKSNQATCIEFAYCFPYGLKKLGNLISYVRDMAEVKVLAKTFNGQNMPLLQIGNKKSQKAIILSARVHPGETVSSFIMEGFVKELVSDNQYSKLLRSHFLFKIVPMLNPDGVMHGNYRFSGYGCDLNRKWKGCRQRFQPEVYYMRQLIRQTNKQKKVCMYIDMHGHSRKKNVFFYGCAEKGSGNTKPREFPFIMEKILDAYKYQNCCFAVQKSKEGTARITAWKELKIDYVYTLESTFCGAEYGPNYLEADYQKIGRKLCEGITCLFHQQIESHSNPGLQKVMQKLAGLKKKIVEQMHENPKLLQIGNEDDSGSDSQPEAGQISDKQRNPETGLPRPEAIRKDIHNNNKSKKAKMSTAKNLSHGNIQESPSFKLKSEAFIEEELPRKAVVTSIGTSRPKNLIAIESEKPQSSKVQIKIANTVNTFELDTLRASSLYQKNVRVHSITRNNHEHSSERSKRLVNPFTGNTPSHQQKDTRLRINLIHGREGAQYRRVRKIAEDNMKRNMMLEQSGGKVVMQLQSNNLTNLTGHVEIEPGNQVIAPRFYPSAHQRTRRISMEPYIKKQMKHDEFRRISVNGDELNVRCFGKHVYL